MFKMGVLILFHIVAFLLIHVSAQPDECPALFMRYSPIHTYCKPDNLSCNIIRSLVTPSDINVILREHNNYRSKIATGKVPKLPTAANMMEMVWNNELAAVAQKHANQCLFQHDCSSCRRVQNYGVGQNLALQQVTNSPKVPDPNWPSAIKSWFDEIDYFSKSAIDPFIAPPSEHTYGHFSQVLWSESWQVGCGQTTSKKDKMYQTFYTCNYGPAGNTVSESMYKKGKPCSACPVNSCCDETCGAVNKYPGLCKLTDNKGPTYEPQGKYIFYCDFNNQSDCKSFVNGPNKWLRYTSLSGNYLGIVLKGGEESTMVFSNQIKPSTSVFCFVIHYRKGPNVAGQEDANIATETFTIIGHNHEAKEVLPNFGGDAAQQFGQFKMSLSWNMETQYKITFSVPPGKPDQFLEIQKIYVTEGSCTQ